MMLPTHRIRSLDSIRGLAALTVVLNHIWESISVSKETSIAPLPFSIGMLWNPHFLFTYSPLQILVGGTPAVLLFFVLSGFVLSIPWHEGWTPAYKDFALRRFCRIYLPFLASIVGAVSLAMLTQSSSAPDIGLWSDFWRSHPVTPNLIAQHLTMGLERNEVLNPPAWSLVHEMRISLIFPLLVLFYLRYGLRRTAIFTLAFYLVIWVILRTVMSEKYYGAETYLGSGLMTLHFVPFFMAGIVLASLYLNQKIELERCGLPMRCLLWTIALVSMFTIWWRVSAMLAHLIFGTGSVMLIALSLSSPMAQKVLAHRPIQWLGRVSYSLYLVHMPILYFCLFWLYGRLPIFMIYLTSLIFIGVLSEASYRWIELPSIKLGRQLTAKAKLPMTAKRTGDVPRASF